VATGLVLAASLPPWGWWPLGFVGIALLDRVLADQPVRNRFWRGSGVAFGLFVITLWWIHDLTLPGYFIAVAVFAAMAGLCLMLVPPGRGRWVALPAAWTLAEVWKGAFPFGGVPISNLAIGQAGGPFAPTVRLFGAASLTLLVVIGGVGLSALAARRWRAGVAAVAVVAIATGAAAIAPRGHDTGRPLRVAVVQGGGPQGTRAINTDARKVFDRHLAASKSIQAPVDLVLWPEDVVDVNADDPTASEHLDIADAPEGDDLSALARRLHATVVAGIVQDDGAKHFLNFSAAWDPDGRLVDRYEKVHRVPFGEYVPLRWLVEPFAGPSLTARDAVIGRRPAVLHTAVGPLGVAISWEIFFSHRARSAIGDGGQILLNPTNGSTYTGTLVQTQQVASSRLRALEEGRWVLQAAPTGFSAIIDADGRVHARTGISEQRVLQSDQVRRRTGHTIYTHVGEWPVLAAIVALLVAAWTLDHRDRRDRQNPAIRAEVAE
jgi:apolipoprotein N-acyltransferase